jgi:hypothetical protein
MAINNYADLQVTIADWLDRSDLTAQIHDFITLAEGEMSLVFKLKTYETESTLSTTQGSRYVELPGDYDLPIALWMTVWTPRKELIYMPVEQQNYVNVSAYPQYYGIDNGKIAFDVNASGNFSLVFRYRKTYQSQALSTSNPTNWILSKYPNAYLWGALAQAALFLPGEDRLQPFVEKFEQMKRDIMNHEAQHDNQAILMTDYPINNRMNAANAFFSGM